MSRPTTEAIATAPATRPSTRPLWLRLLSNPQGAIAIAFLLLLVVVGIFGSAFAPVAPNATDLAAANALPFSDGHLFGADASGRDVFSRLVIGTRETIIGCLVVLGVSVALGVTAGLIAGFYRGAAEAVLSFVSDSIMSLPGIVLLIALYALTGPNILAAMAVFGVLIAPAYFRLVRAVVVGVRSELYVDAAKVVGLSDLRIIGRHVLWAVRGPVVIQSAFVLAAGIGIQAGVDFLGLGNPSVPSWGGVLQDSFDNIYGAPSGVVWPAVLISVTILALVLLGNVLRDVLQSSGSTRALRPRRRRELADAAAKDRVRPGDDALENDAILSIRGLRMGYPRDEDSVTEVLHGVDLDVRRGEIHGLVGESGSGKSQIAFSILGILPKEAVALGGSILLDGVDILADPAALRAARGRRIAYIPQEPMSNLDPSFTIGAQLVFGLRAVTKTSASAARAHVLSLLERVGIRDAERVMKLYPHEISGGMAQRVLICGALAADPDVIIADEPTTALDVTVQAEVLELLRGLSAERGLAMILVTHNLGVVADLCDTVSVMQRGEIVEHGDVESIFANPQKPYTRELLSSSRSVELTEVTE
ncbi:dipeptide/oligopeptide/nickel ABC transporter permease/ATP-binding protein [Rathayibacter sp. Leaf296]|uniref:dipeptide/oligopeptide/nickel ABC transporter permease/ATP-binding protein n=1 Tax=Rathayibacter sp. Leaf296 TaxID=1736327 RepID=UPI0007029A24|nr:dipeptide/oligopeptide/nickel ABC transporter permease/ATP-binding protein [Rathayibacter sp. Leaf296]KQQ09680.1 ABC transporter [Rathayibacter sp. Leaf296]